MYDLEKERLKDEVAELKAKVKKNPWPWLVGGFVLGTIFGVIFF